MATDPQRSAATTENSQSMVADPISGTGIFMWDSFTTMIIIANYSNVVGMPRPINTDATELCA